MGILTTLFGLGAVAVSTAKDTELKKEMNERFKEVDDNVAFGKKMRAARDNIFYQLEDVASEKAFKVLNDYYDVFLIQSNRWKDIKNNKVPNLLKCITNEHDKKLIMNYYNNYLKKHEERCLK